MAFYVLMSINFCAGMVFYVLTSISVLEWGFTYLRLFLCWNGVLRAYVYFCAGMVLYVLMSISVLEWRFTYLCLFLCWNGVLRTYVYFCARMSFYVLTSISVLEWRFMNLCLFLCWNGIRPPLPPPTPFLCVKRIVHCCPSCRKCVQQKLSIIVIINVNNS